MKTKLTDYETMTLIACAAFTRKVINQHRAEAEAIGLIKNGKVLPVLEAMWKGLDSASTAIPPAGHA